MIIMLTNFMKKMYILNIGSMKGENIRDFAEVMKWIGSHYGIE